MKMSKSEKDGEQARNNPRNPEASDKPDNPVILVDSREQLPYKFDGVVETRRIKLVTGDYSLFSLENRVAVERKSLDDFTSSLILDRFWREIDRFDGFERVAVIVEGSMEDVSKWMYRSGNRPESIFGAVAKLQIDHGIHVIFAGDRPHGSQATLRFLLRYWETEKKKSKKCT